MRKQEQGKGSSNKGFRVLCIALFMLFTLLLLAKSSPATTISAQPNGNTSIDAFIVQGTAGDSFLRYYNNYGIRTSSSGRIGYENTVWGNARYLMKINWSGLGFTPANVTSIDNISVQISSDGGANAHTITLHQMLYCWDEGTKDGTVGNSSGYANSTGGSLWTTAGTAGTHYNSSVLGKTSGVESGETLNYSITPSIATSWLKGTLQDCGFIMISDQENTAMLNMIDSDYTTAGSRPTWFITFTEADPAKPTWANIYNNASTTTYKGGHVNWTANISDETALSNARLTTNDTGTWANQSSVTIGGTNYNFSYQYTITANAGKTVCGRVWFSDAVGNVNETDNSCFVVEGDIVSPTWVNVYNNASTVTEYYGHVNWTANISDNIALSYAWLEHNGTVAYAYKENVTNISATASDWFDYGKIFDNDWETNTTPVTEGGTYYIYINYTKPANATGAEWRIKSGVAEENVTIPYGCWNVSTETLMLRIWVTHLLANSVEWDCFNGYTWATNLKTHQSGDEDNSSRTLFEEAIWWATSGLTINDTRIAVSGTNYNVSQQIATNITPGKYVCGRFWFNDTSNNINVTDWSCFTVTDLYAPTWNSISNNASTVTQNGGNVSVGIRLADDIALGYAWLEINDTGSWANKTRVSLTGTSTVLNETFIVTANPGKTVCAKYWFNDTVNNQNESSTTCFVVRTSINLKLQDIYDSSYILAFTANTNTSLTTTTATGNASIILDEGTYQVNFTHISADSYFNKSYTLIVSGNRYNFTGNTYQSVLYINASTKITYTPIYHFNVSANLTENVTTNGLVQLYVRAGTYRLRANSSNSTYPYTIYNDSITVAALQNKTVSLFFHNVELNVSAQTYFDGATVANFSINISYPATNYFETVTTTTGTAWFNITQGSYDITIWNNTYQVDNDSVSITKTPYNHTFLLMTAGYVYLKVYNEDTLKLMNATIDLIGGTDTANYTTSNGTLLFTGLTEGTEYELRYTYTGFRPRQYFFTLIGGGAEAIELYLLSEINGSYIVFSVYDENGMELEDVTLKLLRYYVEKDAYVTVAMTKTNFNGQGQLDAVQDIVHYQIIAEYGGNTVFVSSDTVIMSTVLSMTVDTSTDIMQKITLIKDFSYLLTFNNDTKLFTLVFNDITNEANNVCLDVIKLGALENSQVCNNCVTTNTGTLTCNLTAWSGYADKGSYLARVNVFYDGAWWIVGQLEKSFTQPLAFSSPAFAMFLNILFIITMISISLVNPIISILLTIFGLVMLNLFGLAALPITVIIPIILVGGLLAMFMRRT